MLLQSPAASKNVVALTIGLEDYTADMGVAKTTELQRTALRAFATGERRKGSWACRRSIRCSVMSDDMSQSTKLGGEIPGSWGLEGMGCIHPAQIPVIHEAFAPSASEIEKATKIVAAFEEAQQRGLGVVSLGSKMIDPQEWSREHSDWWKERSGWEEFRS